MRSFFRDQKPIAVAGIKCNMNLFANEKSATTTNIADEFDLIMEREGKVKHISLYHERKFCKLGYAGEVEHFPKDILAYKRLIAYWQDFEAKVIRPDMILHNSKSCPEVDKITKKLINLWRDEKKAGLLHKRCYKVSDMEQTYKSTNPKCMQR